MDGAKAIKQPFLLHAQRFMISSPQHFRHFDWLPERSPQPEIKGVDAGSFVASESRLKW